MQIMFMFTFKSI